MSCRSACEGRCHGGPRPSASDRPVVASPPVGLVRLGGTFHHGGKKKEPRDARPNLRAASAWRLLMTRNTLIRNIVAAILLLTAVSACAPGRSIVRGNWPDGRIEGNGSRVVRRVPAPAPEPVEEWVAADPMPALSAADLNRMGVLQTIHFGFDVASVSGMEQQSTLEMNAMWLLENPGARIIIEGHCDDRGTRRYNLDLGQRR